MDHQNIFFLGCLTAAVAISAFILWGPAPRPRKKKGHIVGLTNLGSTCFLNTLLQALASCALFIQWLMQQKYEKNSLTSSLSEVLWLLNGEGKDETFAPVEVLSALKRHGWMVPSGEQDAHELFHVIVSTLQDENKKVYKVGSLSDALPHSTDKSGDNLNAEYQEEAWTKNCNLKSDVLPSQFCKTDKEKATFAQGDSGNPRPEETSCGDSEKVNNKFEKVNEEDTLNCSLNEMSYSLRGEIEKEVLKSDCDVEEAMNLQPDFPNNEEDMFVESENIFNISPGKFKTSQESISNKSSNFQGCYDRATGKSLYIPHKDSLPFQGLLTSTLQCSACGYYSSLHYDTFDSLSLPLGDNFHFRVLKLQDLLKKFVKTEIIPDVECEKCCKKTTALKTMNFGKLPACLCLHIARTTWQSYSHCPTKRDDFVDFPEYLPMDEYTVSARLKKGGSVSSLHSMNSETSGFEEKTYKHVYRLKSVVVHLGDVSSGHFLTYRRGALNSLQRHRIGKLAGAYKDSRRWYLTSDDNVKGSSLCEAMESLAYMLFYEKCTPDMFPVNDESNL